MRKIPNEFDDDEVEVKDETKEEKEMEEKPLDAKALGVNTGADQTMAEY